MNRKTLITMAVAGACAFPLLATAGGQRHDANAGQWEVATPASVSESAPWAAAEQFRTNIARSEAMPAGEFAEVMTPHSVSESAPWRTAEDLRQRSPGARTNTVSLANPLTPSSPNESGPDRYAEDIRAHMEQVASVEHARIAAARSYSDSVAAASASDPIAELANTHAEIMSSNQAPLEQRDREQVALAPEGLVDSRRSGVAELRTDIEGQTPKAAPEPAVGSTDSAGAAAQLSGAAESPEAAAL